LGARVPFTWRLSRRGVRKLALRLVAREEATYQHGSSTTTDKIDFHRAVLVESTDRRILSGRAELVLPEVAAAPSLEAANNKIVWELSVDGEVPWLADVNDRYVLPVRAPASNARAPATERRSHNDGGLTLSCVERFAPGETLVFAVARDAEPADTAAEGPLTMQLGWFTEGKGTRDAAIVWTEKLASLAPGAKHVFEVRLPEDPWTFSGKLVALNWRLEVLNAKGAPLVWLPLVVAPGGEEVALVALPPEPSRFQK